MFEKNLEIHENGSLWRLHLAPGGHLGAKMAPKIAKRSPKRRQDGPTWLQDGVPNLLQNHENSIEKMLFFWLSFLIEFWRDLGAKIDEKSSPKSKKT